MAGFRVENSTEADQHGRSLSGARGLKPPPPHGLRGAYYQADGRLRGPYSY